MVSSSSASCNGSSGLSIVLMFGLFGPCPAIPQDVSSVVDVFHSCGHFDHCVPLVVQRSSHHAHVFVQLPVGIIWCFTFNCEVPSVGSARMWYHSARVCFVCDRTITPKNRPPLSLFCLWFRSHQKATLLCLSRFNDRWLAVSIFRQQTCPRLSAELQLQRPEELCPSCRGMHGWHRRSASRKANSKRGLSASPTGPDLHRLCNGLNAATPACVAMFVSICVTIRQLALNLICVSICVPTFVTIHHLARNLTVIPTHHLVLVILLSLVTT